MGGRSAITNNCYSSQSPAKGRGICESADRSQTGLIKTDALFGGVKRGVVEDDNGVIDKQANSIIFAKKKEEHARARLGRLCRC